MHLPKSKFLVPAVHVDLQSKKSLHPTHDPETKGLLIDGSELHLQIRSIV